MVAPTSESLDVVSVLQCKLCWRREIADGLLDIGISPEQLTAPKVIKAFVLSLQPI